MKYEKPEINFQKFYTESFLEDELLSSGGGSIDHEIFGSTDGFNGAVTLNSDGVGGWFNG